MSSPSAPIGPPLSPNVWELRTDGYHGHAIPLIAVIITAYPPSQGYTDMFTPDELTNAPGWTMQQFYDVDVRVAAADIRMETTRRAAGHAPRHARRPLQAHRALRPQTRLGL